MTVQGLPWFAALVLTSVISAQTTIDFGISPVGPITNNANGAGDFEGNEYASLGVLFFGGDARHQLNIGCGTGAGSTSNCLSADESFPNDFEGKVWALFRLSGVQQVTDRIIIEYVNAEPPGTRTIIRDAANNVLLDQSEGNVNFYAPGIASVETQYTFDGANSFTFGPLSPASSNFRLGPPLDGCGPPGTRLELYVERPTDIGKPGSQFGIGLRAGPAQGLGLLLFGATSSLPYPVELASIGAPDCFLRNDVTFALRTSFGASGSTARLLIETPEVPSLRGTSYFVQGAALWPEANAAGLATSNQLTVNVGT